MKITDTLAIALAKAITCESEAESKAHIELAENLASELDSETLEECKILASKIAAIHDIRKLKEGTKNENITYH